MTDKWDDEFKCPYCGADLVSATGNKHSDVLIVGSEPGDEEIQQGIPWCGATGRVLRAEMSYLGLDLKAYRRTNLWLHAPNKNEECFKMGVEQVLKEAKGKKIVFLLGSEPVMYFTGKNVSDVSGLKVKSPLLSAPVVLASQNPAVVFKGTVGEIHHSLKIFKSEVERI